MKKHIVPIIIAIIAIVAAFLTGLFYGRKLTSAPMQIAGIISENTGPSPDFETVDPGTAALENLSININTATPAEFSLLPGIGDVLSMRIVTYREQNGPFGTIEALMDVEGISQKRFDAIKDYITTGE